MDVFKIAQARSLLNSFDDIEEDSNFSWNDHLVSEDDLRKFFANPPENCRGFFEGEGGRPVKQYIEDIEEIGIERVLKQINRETDVVHWKQWGTPNEAIAAFLAETFDDMYDLITTGVNW